MAQLVVKPGKNLKMPEYFYYHKFQSIFVEKCSLGYDTEEICKITGLERDEIEAL